MKSWVYLLLAVLMLAGCATRGPQQGTSDTPETRAERLETWRSWGLSGRLGLDDGRQGGSGRLDWRQRTSSTELKFRAALGQGAWTLSGDESGARLELADGSEREAPDMESLVEAQTGWRLPVDALSWWVRGLVWPLGPPPDLLVRNDDGLPELLEQAGWTIEFRRYTEAGKEQLPARLEASKDGLTVKLAISRWQPPRGR